MAPTPAKLASFGFGKKSDFSLSTITIVRFSLLIYKTSFLPLEILKTIHFCTLAVLTVILMMRCHVWRVNQIKLKVQEVNETRKIL